LDSIKINDIIQELYKLCTMVLPEKTTWSIDEIHTRIYSNKSVDKSQSFQTLKQELTRLEDKGAVVLVDEYQSITLVAPKLSELLVDTISKI
jgi:hypothetical protein